MKNRKGKIQNSIGAVLILAWTYVVIFYHYNWGDANQLAFHLPLIVMWWMIFSSRLDLFVLGILNWVSYLIADNGLIDEVLYRAFLDAGIFPEFMVHGEFVNAQFTKLLLYAVSLSIMLVMLFFKKKRTTVRCFSFLSALSCLFVTMLIHDAMPLTTLKWEKEIIQANMSSILNFMDSNPSTNLASICKSFDLTCYKNIKREDIGKITSNAIVRDTLLETFDSMEQNTAFEYNHFAEETVFVRQIFGLTRRGRERFHVLVEDKMISKSQLVNEMAFGKLNTFANLVWGQILLLIGIFHTYEVRKRIFTKP